ncbi:DNA-binding response regulator [Mucilaginibacter pedocola]|uniref:DNA-binding response regulator n=2 Tax=Mucilaginibacter pedocola TaxID=1792845 RepID=A0A1S9PJS3_9SPHI|nr:DNA-binding response regulator [Mucilaginibacter pedocola]
MNCVIVDDEPLAREGLADFVEDVDFLQLAGMCENPVQLINFLQANTVDLIFLDIQMPKMSGMDFLKITKNPPMVILTTAYPNYAVEGFQLNVLDYLLKPITFDRFFMAVNKARDYQRFLQFSSGQQQAPAVPQADYFFIKCGGKYEKLFLDEVLYIESMQNYINIFTTKSKYTTQTNLKSLEQYFDKGAFMRVHKSYMVALRKIEKLEGNEIFIQTHRIPLSRNYRDEVIATINSKLLDRRG